jgi:hypothetical protein
MFEYDLRPFLKYGVGLVLFILLIFTGLYVTSPVVESSVDEVVFGYNPTQPGLSEDSGFQRSFSRNITLNATDSYTDSYSLVINYDAQREVVYQRHHSEFRENVNHFESYILNQNGYNRGFTKDKNAPFSSIKKGAPYIEGHVLRVSGPESVQSPSSDGYHSGLSNVFVSGVNSTDSGSLKIEDSEFRKTGEKKYNGRSVSVYKKVKDAGEIVLFDSSVIYVDNENAIIVYADADIFFIDEDSSGGGKEKSLSVSTEFREQDVMVADWVDDVKMFNASELTYVNLLAGESSVYFKSKPLPQNLSDSVKIKFLRNGEIVESEIVDLYEFKNRKFEIPNESKEGYTVVVDAGGKEFNFANVGESSVSHGNPYAMTDISTTESSIEYNIKRYYADALANTVEIQYGNQTETINSSSLLDRPIPQTPVIFNNTNSSTHVSLKPYSKEVFLDPIDGESGPSGSILVGFERQGGSQSHIDSLSLWQGGRKIAAFSISEKVNVLNIPVGKTKIVVTYSDGSRQTQYCKVEESTTCWTEDFVVETD